MIYGTLVLFAWLLWRLRKQKLDHFWFQLFLFGYIFLTVIAVNGLRVDLSMIHPYIAAPRYFFYPFVSLAFFLCWLGYHSDRLGKIIAIGMLLLAISNGLGHYSQPHDRMNWRGDVAQCLANKEGHHFSSFFDGKATTTWDLYLTHEQCEQLSD
ncbi:MAG: hypothetical protein HWD59_08600 [Coxiellaceae bacterium]|nr:MAG: hypothetical protein HWD59_08600 [Coxiellaceae bacterium]